MFVGVHIGSINFMTFQGIKLLLTLDILLLSSDDDCLCLNRLEVTWVLTNKI
jgi:hypothetical protein